MGGAVIDDRYTALKYLTDNETWTVAANVLVSNANGGDDDAIESIYNGSTLINNGYIFSNGDSGVEFSGNNAIITNNEGALIKGPYGVAYSDGSGLNLTNHGTIYGYDAAGVWLFNAKDVVVNNFGSILTNDNAFYIITAPDVPGPIINNSGLVKSTEPGGAGFYVGGANDVVTVINNQAGGEIQAVDTAIYTSSGRVSVINHGKIDGDIDCNGDVGNVDDVIINFGNISGDVFLGLGNDNFDGTGGTSGAVFGEQGNDTLIGGNASDTLNGGSGADTLRGGRGTDLLTGGTEQDFFDFNSVNDSLKGSKRDQILDFNSAELDKIDLQDIDAKKGSGNQAFKFIGTAKFHDVKGELRYIDKGASCIVQGDVNGDGKADFEILVKVDTLLKGDFVL